MYKKGKNKNIYLCLPEETPGGYKGSSHNSDLCVSENWGPGYKVEGGLFQPTFLNQVNGNLSSKGIWPGVF